VEGAETDAVVQGQETTADGDESPDQDEPSYDEQPDESPDADESGAERDAA
jgi:hypothetical protein